MSVVKVIEVLGQSEKSWEDATRNVLEEVSKTIRNIKSINIMNFKAIVENNHISEYRVDAKVTFLIERHENI